jgi:hypothetical protein
MQYDAKLRTEKEDERQGRQGSRHCSFSETSDSHLQCNSFHSFDGKLLGFAFDIVLDLVLGPRRLEPHATVTLQATCTALVFSIEMMVVF